MKRLVSLPSLCLAVVILFLMLAGGCSAGAAWEPEEGISQRASPIRNGTITGDPEVVQFVNAAGEYCSGTLINPWWVQTAAHCGVYTTDIVKNAVGEIRHPACLYPHSAWPGNSLADVQFVILDAPFTDYHQTSYYWDNSSTLLNKIVTCYGYGLDGYTPGPSGVLRSMTVRVTQATADEIRVEPATGPQQRAEPGDSGGGCLPSRARQSPSKAAGGRPRSAQA